MFMPTLRRTARWRRSVSCDVPGRCSLKRVAHPATFVNLKAFETNRLTGRARMNVRKNARTCPASRVLLYKRVSEQGWLVREASEAGGISSRRGGSGYAAHERMNR